MTMWKWSKTAASNSNADATINWAEGQPPSSVNDSARALMAAVAKYRDDMAGLVLTGGSSTAYTATSNQVYTSNANGNQVTVQFHTANGAAATFALDSQAAKPIRIATGTAVAAGVLLGGSIHKLTYSAGDDCWYLHTGLTLSQPSGTAMLFAQTAAPTGWTKSLTHNNKALRVVSGAASSGGSVDFTTAFASQTPAGTVGSTTLDITQIPAHTHTYSQTNYVNFAPPGTGATVGQNSSTVASGSAGGGLGHTHTFTGSAINLAVAYVDVIIATKD